jgi:hypothetical protein
MLLDLDCSKFFLVLGSRRLLFLSLLLFLREAHAKLNLRSSRALTCRTWTGPLREGILVGRRLLLVPESEARSCRRCSQCSCSLFLLLYPEFRGNQILLSILHLVNDVRVLHVGLMLLDVAFNLLVNFIVHQIHGGGLGLRLL